VNRLYVIGVGYRPFDERTKEIILDSEVLVASPRLFEVFKRYDEFETVKDKVMVIESVEETISFVKSKMYETRSVPGAPQRSHNIVLLGSGDPMFFGIGRRAIEELGKEAVEIIPDLSSIQLAFARIKEPWDDAFLLSLHGVSLAGPGAGPDSEKTRKRPYEIDDIPLLLRRHNKIAILTDAENNPAVIADRLREQPAVTVYVCEKLGYPEEKVTGGSLEEVARMSFGDPNVVILLKQENARDNKQASKRNEEAGFGLRESEIAHSGGLITKDEVRAATIHKLRLPPKGVFWDIGAGSGSISLEAARLFPYLKVFAIEKKEDQISHIKENKIKFDALGIEIIRGEAPDALANLPSPDRVFIGGGGGRLEEIISSAGVRMPAGIIVTNAATIETLNEAIQHLENNGFEVEVVGISISRSKTIANKRHMSALNPVFMITGTK